MINQDKHYLVRKWLRRDLYPKDTLTRRERKMQGNCQTDIWQINAMSSLYLHALGLPSKVALREGHRLRARQALLLLKGTTAHSHALQCSISPPTSESTAQPLSCSPIKPAQPGPWGTRADTEAGAVMLGFQGSYHSQHCDSGSSPAGWNTAKISRTGMMECLKIELYWWFNHKHSDCMVWDAAPKDLGVGLYLRLCGGRGPLPNGG